MTSKSGCPSKEEQDCTDPGFRLRHMPCERVHSLLEWNEQVVFRNATKAAALGAETVAAALRGNIGEIEVAKEIEISIKSLELLAGLKRRLRRPE